MSTYDERLAALEQASVTRTELTKAIDNLTWQSGRTLRDRNQETAISLGILTDDVRILKENVASIKVSLTDLSQELYSMEEKFDKRFDSMEEKLTQILARLP